jgi:predicted transcriptional regulator
MSEPAKLNIRTDRETIAIIDILAKRRKTSRTQWMRDAIQLAISLETSTPR